MDPHCDTILGVFISSDTISGNFKLLRHRKYRRVYCYPFSVSILRSTSIIESSHPGQGGHSLKDIIYHSAQFTQHILAKYPANMSVQVEVTSCLQNLVFIVVLRNPTWHGVKCNFRFDGFYVHFIAIMIFALKNSQ